MRPRMAVNARVGIADYIASDRSAATVANAKLALARYANELALVN